MAVPLTFSQYALLDSLTSDEIYTIELLIESVRSSFDPHYYEHWDERDEAREAADYRPHFDTDLAQLAEEELSKLTWLSFQRVGSQRRPVRDLTALQYLPELDGLILNDNEAHDLTPLRNCKKLSRVSISQNRVKELSPLTGCPLLAELSISQNPLSDYGCLSELPSLTHLEMTDDQLEGVATCGTIPFVRHMTINSSAVFTGEEEISPFPSFEILPELPSILEISEATVQSLSGLERFITLQNLTNIRGPFTSLDPLRNLRNLTHFNLLDTDIKSLAPLERLFELRDIFISTSAKNVDLEPIERLPALHEAKIECSGQEVPGLIELRQSFPSWDVESYSPTPRSVPSSYLQLVDSETFSFFDTKCGYNVEPQSCNRLLIQSERAWLDRRLESALDKFLERETDYELPYRWQGSRSRTLVLYTNHAIRSFPKVVTAIQTVLAHARNEWIVYVQTDNRKTDVTVWVYPEKIQASHAQADIVDKLCKRSWWRR